MATEIKMGFVDGNVTYETRVFTSKRKIYKEKLEGDFQFELYSSNGRNDCARILDEKICFRSNGTCGRSGSKLFKWTLYLNPYDVPSKEYHTVERDAEGNIFFYDGGYMAFHQKKAAAEKEKKMQEVEQILEMAINQNNATYALLEDKEFFLEQMRDFIYDYRFDVQESARWILRNSGECFNNFLRSEREQAIFINELTYDQVTREYPKIKEHDLMPQEIERIVKVTIKEIVEEKRWGSTIYNYRENVYDEIEDAILACVREKTALEEGRKKEEIRRKYPIEKLMELYDSKIRGGECVEEIKKDILRTAEDSLKWRAIDESDFLRNIERAIDWRLEWEGQKKELEAFVHLWGSDTKFVELTEEKKEVFTAIENGEIADEYTMREYELYHKILPEYEALVYGKRGKKLRPTFAAIPAYVEHFWGIVEIAQKCNLINAQGAFVGWEGFKKFQRDVRKYEKSLAK